MKAFIVVAVLALIAVSVSAHGNRGGSSKEKGFFGGFPGFGGYSGYGGYAKSCMCRNQCNGNTGNKNIACSNSRTNYLQCAGTVCTNQACAANQLFNYTTLVCESCPAGFHVNSEKSKCVCDRGTTLNPATGTCGPCPSQAAVTDDICYCSGNTVLNKQSNTCATCPTGSTQTKDACKCTNSQQLWSTADFACKNCPGTVNNIVIGKGWKQVTYPVCQCPSNTVLNPYSISCVTCPTNSAYTSYNGYYSYCKCTDSTQVYDPKTNTCIASSTKGTFPFEKLISGFAGAFGGFPFQGSSFGFGRHDSSSEGN